MARSILLPCALLAVLAGPLRAQGDQATVEAIRSSLEASLIQAMTARDFATLDRLLAPILVSLLADPDTVITRDAAAVHLGSGIETVTRRDGSITRFRQVWTDTWARQPDGSWQCLASQWVELPTP
jgi:hypothetical protein